MDGLLVFVEIEVDPLAGAKHAKDRVAEGVLGQFDLDEISLTEDHTVLGRWVVRLDDTLHGSCVLWRFGIGGSPCRRRSDETPG